MRRSCPLPLLSLQMDGRPPEMAAELLEVFTGWVPNWMWKLGVNYWLLQTPDINHLLSGWLLRVACCWIWNLKGESVGPWAEPLCTGPCGHRVPLPVQLEGWGRWCCDRGMVEIQHILFWACDGWSCSCLALLLILRSQKQHIWLMQKICFLPWKWWHSSTGYKVHMG